MCADDNVGFFFKIFPTNSSTSAKLVILSLVAKEFCFAEKFFALFGNFFYARTDEIMAFSSPQNLYWLINFSKWPQWWQVNCCLDLWSTKWKSQSGHWYFCHNFCTKWLAHNRDDLEIINFAYFAKFMAISWRNFAIKFTAFAIFLGANRQVQYRFSDQIFALKLSVNICQKLH